MLLKVMATKNAWVVTIGVRSKLQNFICNGCHDLTMLCLNLSYVSIIIVKGVGYRCNTDGTKCGEIHLL